MTEEIQYDVFLSHNSQDKPAVERLARRLVDEADLQPFLDKWHLVPGEPWHEAIEEALDACQTVAVFLGPSGIGSWENEEMRSALEERVWDKSRRVIPVLLPGAPEPQERPLPRFLRRLTWVDFRSGLNDTDAFHRLVSGIKGVAPGPAGIDTIEVPFVIFAMTREEASELTSEHIFEDPNVPPAERDQFARLREILGEHDIADILQFYGKTRDEWRPPITGLTPIRETIKEVVYRVNEQHRSKPGWSEIRPLFFSTDFLSDDVTWRGRTWDQLSQKGCMLIIDAISMSHPLLRQKLIQSAFGSNELVSIVVLSPLGPDVLPVNQFLEQGIRTQMQRAFQRYAEHFDILCEFGVGNACRLKRWLFSVLPETAKIVKGQKANPASLRAIRIQLGEPAGMEQLIFGRGGR